MRQYIAKFRRKNGKITYYQLWAYDMDCAISCAFNIQDKRGYASLEDIRDCHTKVGRA